MSIFSSIFHFFSDLFSSVKKAWDTLPVQVQTGLLNGSGILNIINQFVDQDPKLVIATIQKNYPDENLDAIYSGLVTIAKTYNVLPATVPPDLEGIVAVIQTFLKAQEAKSWPAVLFNAASILANILAGADTPYEIIVSVLQFVYTTFIKNKEIQFASVPPATV